MLSPAGGRFEGPVTVAIDAPTAGASIAYTLDAGRARWLLYAAPITLEASATVRARAVCYGWAESAEVAASFEVAPR